MYGHFFFYYSQVVHELNQYSEYEGHNVNLSEL